MYGWHIIIKEVRSFPFIMKRIRKIKRTSILSAVIVLLIMCGGIIGGIFVLKTREAAYDMKINALETQINFNTHNVYISTVDIK